MGVLTAVYACLGCDGEETDGIWPAPPEGDEQDTSEPPVADQVCPAGHVQTEAYPGYWFKGEAG